MTTLTSLYRMSHPRRKPGSGCRQCSRQSRPSPTGTSPSVHLSLRRPGAVNRGKAWPALRARLPRDCTPSASSVVRRRFAPLLVGKPFPERKNDPTPFVARRSTSVLNELRDGHKHRRVSARPRNTRAGLCPEILTRSFFFLMKRQKKSRMRPPVSPLCCSKAPA